MSRKVECHLCLSPHGAPTGALRFVRTSINYFASYNPIHEKRVSVAKLSICRRYGVINIKQRVPELLQKRPNLVEERFPIIVRYEHNLGVYQRNISRL